MKKLREKNKVIGNRYDIYLGGSVIDRETQKEIRLIDHVHILSFIKGKILGKNEVDFIAQKDEEDILKYIQKGSIPLPKEEDEKLKCPHKWVIYKFSSNLLLESLICIWCKEIREIGRKF